MVQEQIANTVKKDQAFIKQDPRLTFSCTWRNIGFWTLGIWIILLIVVTFLKRNLHIDLFSSLYVVNAISAGVIGSLGSQIYYIHHYKKMEHQRQAVAQGYIQLLADQQPVPTTHTHSFPPMFPYKYLNIARIFSWFILAFAILFIAATFWPGGFSFGMAFCAVIAIVSLVALYIQGSRYKQVELIADENGLTLKSVPVNKVQYIPWHEARLFAIDTSIGEVKQKAQYPRFFELASEQEVIRWPGSDKRARDNYALNMQTLLSEEEYTKQLENLHALIVKKTLLPLNDLRKQA